MELVRDGHPDDVINVLLEWWCTINQTDKAGRTALYWATKKNKIETIDALLNFPGVDHHAGLIRSHNVISPLWIAATRGLPEACHRLLRAGALPTGIGHRVFRRNYTPLEGAIERSFGTGYSLEGVIHMALRERTHGIIKCIWIMEAWILRERVDKLLRAKLMMWLGTLLRESTNWIYGDFSFSE